MTSLAFILGVVPLVLASGAGASARVSIGITVFTGMIASTCLAVLFVPPFFAVVQRFEEWRRGHKGLSPAGRPAEWTAAVNAPRRGLCSSVEFINAASVTIWTQGFVWYSRVPTQQDRHGRLRASCDDGIRAHLRGDDGGGPRSVPGLGAGDRTAVRFVWHFQR